MNCSVSLGKNGELLDHNKAQQDFKHSREITLLIEDMLKRNSIAFDEISAVAVSEGPGSYTGLRVGVSAAKGICFAKKIPLIAVRTLKIIAKAQQNRLEGAKYLIPMIDARRDEVYFQLYDADLNSLNDADNTILTSKSFAELSDSKNSIICGNAAEKAQNIMENDDFRYFSVPALAEDMVSLSYEAYNTGKFEDLAYFRPFYLKPPNITKSKKPLF